MAGSSWNVFVANTKAIASQVNANFDWIEGAILPQTNGVTADDTHTLGNASFKWLAIYVNDIQGSARSIIMLNALLSRNQ